ncbi:MAG: 30S ribosomal protein S1 [Chlorobi bacterium]|nr:30S ribosomal protein S1 [Chlorobiota bacterium]
MTETADLPMTNDVEEVSNQPTSTTGGGETSVQSVEKSSRRLNKSVLAALLEGDIPLSTVDDSQYASLLERNTRQIREDEMVHGVITAITKDEIWVDVGFKSLGVIPRAEFSEAADTLKIGDEIDVFVDRLEDSQGRLALSRRRADFMKTWQQIVELYEKQEIVNVRILRRIKGGFVVDLLGIEAFLPGSQVDMRPVRDFDAWIGKTLDVRVVKVNNPSENVVVSHKVLLEEQIQEQRQRILSMLERGLVLEGHVKAIADFGVFIDLGGVDGLVHITDLSWGRVNHPSEVVSLDEKVKVVVLDFDEAKRRISLGMKQLTPHPWEQIGEKYQPGTKVTGRVVSITDYGAFIEIEKGIEGLIHISEMSWTQHIKHPSQLVSLGQVIEAVVLSIDKENRKLALGIKQLQPDPWNEIVTKYPVGSVHKGIVRNITNYGVFVELEPGVEGLVHVGDLSWTKKIRHPGEVVKRGDPLDVVVLALDSEQRRISLGHKQVTENPWEVYTDRFKPGSLTEGKIIRIVDKGVVVELPEGVEGFVPASHLSFAPVKSIADYFAVGDTLPLKIIEFHDDDKRIVLSAVDALREKGEDAMRAYNQAHAVPGADDYAFADALTSLPSPPPMPDLPTVSAVTPAAESLPTASVDEPANVGAGEASPALEQEQQDEVQQTANTTGNQEQTTFDDSTPSASI